MAKIKIMNLRESLPSKEYDFRIDRNSPIGNPFNINQERNRKKVIIYFERFLKNVLKNPKDKESKPIIAYLNQIRNSLKKHGKVRLFCWCSPLPCHGDVIKKYLKKGKL